MTTLENTQTSGPSFATGKDVDYLDQDFAELPLKMVTDTVPITDGFGHDGMVPTFSKDIMVQPRTLKLAKPDIFYFEPESAKRKDDSGNTHNQIHRGVHQVDPNRMVSWVGVMPSLELLAQTDNPFPADIHDESITTSEAYRAHQIIPHVTWNILSQIGGPIKGSELAEKVFNDKRVSHLIVPGQKPDSKTKATFKDTLRELRLYGLIMFDKFSKVPASATYIINPNRIKIAA